MPSTLPDVSEFMRLPWNEIEPHYRELETVHLSQDGLAGWLQGWSDLAERVSEAYWRLYVAVTLDTTDTAAEARFNTYLEEIYPAAQAQDQRLKRRLLQMYPSAESSLELQGFEIPLRNLRTEADLFQEANLPLLTEEKKLVAAYDRLTGAQTVKWEGEERTLQQLQPLFQDPDRSVRERAWRLEMGRWLEDREAVNTLWGKFLAVRRQLAQNAGFPDYRSYRWRQLLRHAYTPQDCFRFHQAIEAVVVPAMERVNERRRCRLGVATLRPWDLEVEPRGFPPLRPFESVASLEAAVERIFHHLDPQLGGYFTTMRQEGLLDLDNRKGKAAGGYCTDFPVARRPFIFMNAVGIHDDVQTLLHESGHAFHVFESAHLPYFQQKQIGMEIAEVASMAMELLAAPYLSAGGGLYSSAEAARAMAEHLERSLRFWPYMAVVDAFQHWVFEYPDAASDPAQCDAHWGELWDRFMRGYDWAGLEQEKLTGWHRKGHIHQDPFYYVEYGLAQLGAVQVWRNARENPRAALAGYRRALSLGATRPLPDLFAAAGARLAFDADTLGQAVALMEATLTALEPLSEM